jgi:hypothetical protein
VTFVTPDFSHAERQYKSKLEPIDQRIFDVEYIHVPKYSKNLSIARMVSHLMFSLKLRSLLNRLKIKPDIIFCMMPPSGSAYVCGQYCKKERISFVVDVIDLWPDSLIPIFRGNRLLNLILFPWKYVTKEAYKMATYISGESKAYASVAHTVNPNVPWSHTYLGVNKGQTLKLVSQSKIEIKKPDDEIWICYGGSLGISYDFISILNALTYIQGRHIKYKMFFIGDGEKRQMIEKFTSDNLLKVEITGRIAYIDYLKHLSLCDIGINSFIKGTQVVHSFKFNDYVASYLFVLNNLSGETSEMITNYKIGLNFNESNLSEVLYDVCLNWDKYKTYRSNLDSLIRDELDSDTIYKNLANNILKSIV